MRWIAILCLACSPAALRAPPGQGETREPEPADPDGDAVAGDDDICPCDPEDLDGFEDADGCVDFDNDGDHAFDVCDMCPNDAEVFNGIEDLDGCPDQTFIRIDVNQIRILEHIFFEKDSARIQGESVPIIEAVAQVLADYPEVTRLEVQGHCSTGERRPAQLSERRAEAIRDALIQRGVDPARLVAHGYGESQPIMPNDTPQGRAMNRRGDFLLLERADAAPNPQPPPEPRNPCPNGPPPRPPSAC